MVFCRLTEHAGKQPDACIAFSLDAEPSGWSPDYIEDMPMCIIFDRPIISHGNSWYRLGLQHSLHVIDEPCGTYNSSAQSEFFLNGK